MKVNEQIQIFFVLWVNYIITIVDVYYQSKFWCLWI